MNSKQNLFFILFLLFFFSLFGKESNSIPKLYRQASRSWRSSSALSHDNATAVYRGKSGFVWVGTIEGLTKIDGNGAKIFTSRSYPELLSNRVYSISGDDDRIFVVTARGISVIKGGDKIEKLVEESGFFASALTSDGAFFALKGKELVQIKDNKINRLTILNGLPEGNFSAIFSDKNKIYIGNENGGIFVYEGGRFSNNLCEANSEQITAIGGKGEIIFGTVGGSLYKIEKGKCSKSGEFPEAPLAIAENDGVKAIVTENALYFIQNGESAAYRDCCNLPGKLSSLFFDDEGGLWIAGNRGLTFYYNGRFKTLGKEEGLSFEMVYAMAEDERGNLWVGSRGGGLFYYDNQKFKRLQDVDKTITPFIGGLTLDDNGDLWVGTSRGIIAFNPENPDQIRRTKSVKKGEIPLASAFLQDSRKRMWAGTVGGAIYLLTKEGWAKIREVGGDKDDFVASIIEDKSGKIWFATSRGLLFLEGETFKSLTKSDGLSDDSVLTLFEDKSGVIFAGTMRRGLSLVMPDGKIAVLDSSKGLCSDAIFSIVADEEENLWFGSTRGIFSLPRQTVIDSALDPKGNLKCFQFDSQDGIKRAESTGGVQAVSILRNNGELWFSTVEGIAVLQKEGALNQNIQLEIESLLINGKTVPVSENLEIKDEVSLLEFKFAAGKFVHPDRLNIRYMLKPYDSDWKRLEESKQRVIGYQKIKSGDYSFKIEASDEKGKFKTETIDFTVKNDDFFLLLTVGAVLFSAVAAFFVFVLARRRTKRKNGEKAQLFGGVSLETEEDGLLQKLLKERETSAKFNAASEGGAPSKELKDESLKYEKSRLDEDIAAAYAQELKSLMEEKELYKNPELTLPELAKQLNLSTNILSQVINGYCKQNFYAFINIYRLESVIEMMKRPENKNRGILDLAYIAGFKSKTTFNAIFKKQIGVTPSEYRKKISNSSEKTDH